MPEQWRRFREKLRLCDPVGDVLDGSAILPIVVGDATRWIRLDRLIQSARSLSAGTAAPAASSLPTGTVIATLGAVPAGWLRCDGALVSRTAYPKLFALLGTQHGKGDGSTTFQLPDCTTRLTVGHAPEPTWIIAA